MANFLQRLVNFFPIDAGSRGRISNKGGNEGAIVNAGGSKNATRNLGNTRIPIQMPRIAQDIGTWRNWIAEAERAWWPFRVLMQQGYIDTVLNAHVRACMDRRKNLTLLREFEFRNTDGSCNEEWTKYFHKRWFEHNFVNYTLDALFYGYNLISIGDIKDGSPINPSIITRWHISPDRDEVGTFIYSPTGQSFEKGRVDDFHVFVTTINDTGVNSCGYGLLYPVAFLEILLKNNTGFNTDFIEMFAQPYRVLKTSKTEGAERDEAERAMAAMGSAGYAILDLMDELEFMTDGAKGNGYKSYNDFDLRLKGDISKIILGHADAISSVPGKLGASQQQNSATNDADAATPIARALRDIQTADGKFCEYVYNDMLIPKLRNLGIAVPEGGVYYLNDAEERAIQDEKNNVNQKFATIVMTLAQAQVAVSPECIAANMVGLPASALSKIEDPSITPNPLKEPKDQIESKTPLKEKSKNRDGKQ